MGLFDFIFGNRPKEPKPKVGAETTFKMLNGYVPRFTSFGGEVYESELIRAAIDARATHISKLKVEIQGAAKPALQNKLRHGPNQFQTWSQFMYRLSTILDIHNTAFICPVFDEFGAVSGIYAPLPTRCIQMRGRSIWATEMPCWRSILPGICKARIMSVESGCQYAN